MGNDDGALGVDGLEYARHGRLPVDVHVLHHLVEHDQVACDAEALSGEAGEVAAALSRGQMDALKDGIGDTVVTLIILAQQHDMTLQECLQYAYDEIKGRKGKTINGTFIKEADLKE